METTTRRPGRPAKLRQCLGPCGQLRPSRDFADKTITECRECRRDNEAGPVVRVEAQARALDPFYAPSRQQLQAGVAVAESLQFFASKDILSQFSTGFYRCVCCYSAQHVTDVRGVKACAVCAVQIEACGRCETHRSAQIIPELISNVVPHVPREVHALYEPALTYEPKPPVAVEPDDDP